MSSTVPAAVPAFMAICQAALPVGFQVREGTIFGPYVAPQALLITGVHFTMDTWATLGPDYKHEEHYNISCALCSTAGTDDGPSRLAEVYGLYADISVAVATQPTLTNTVRVAGTRQLDYTSSFDSKGLSVGLLSFEVQCQARATSLT